MFWAGGHKAEYRVWPLNLWHKQNSPLGLMNKAGPHYPYTEPHHWQNANRNQLPPKQRIHKHETFSITCAISHWD